MPQEVSAKCQKHKKCNIKTFAWNTVTFQRKRICFSSINIDHRNEKSLSEALWGSVAPLKRMPSYWNGLKCFYSLSPSLHLSVRNLSTRCQSCRRPFNGVAALHAERERCVDAGQRCGEAAGGNLIAGPEGSGWGNPLNHFYFISREPYVDFTLF